MSTETPIQIDLSQDASWDQVDDSQLTPDDKQLLKERFTEESEGIIYLTRNELSELKFILSEEKSASHDADFDEFIEDQKTEGLSSSDIFSGIEGGNSEELQALGDTLDSLSEEMLFGNEGILSGLKLSGIAQDNITTSLSLSIFGKLDIGEALNGDITEVFSNAVKNFEGLQVLANQSITVAGGVEVPNLDIRNGERNYIFMDTNIGKDFFDALLTTQMTNDEIKVYIEDRNLPVGSETEIVNNIQGFSADTAEKMSEYLALYKTSLPSEDIEVTSQQEGVDPLTVIDADDIPNPEDLDEMKEKGGFFAMLAEFFETIIHAMRNLADSIPDKSQETDGTEADTEATPEEVAPTLQQQARVIFREKLTAGSITSFEVSEILEFFPEEGELSPKAQQIIRYIDSIPDYEGETDFGSKFENFFAEKTEGGIVKIDAFIQAGDSRMITEGKSVQENLASTLQSYIEYRTNGDRIPYQEWFDSIDNVETDTNTLDTSASE